VLATGAGVVEARKVYVLIQQPPGIDTLLIYIDGVGWCVCENDGVDDFCALYVAQQVN